MVLPLFEGRSGLSILLTEATPGLSASTLLGISTPRVEFCRVWRGYLVPTLGDLVLESWLGGALGAPGVVVGVDRVFECGK